MQLRVDGTTTYVMSEWFDDWMVLFFVPVVMLGSTIQLEMLEEGEGGRRKDALTFRHLSEPWGSRGGRGRGEGQLQQEGEFFKGPTRVSRSTSRPTERGASLQAG